MDDELLRLLRGEQDDVAKTRAAPYLRLFRELGDQMAKWLEPYAAAVPDMKITRGDQEHLFDDGSTHTIHVFSVETGKAFIHLHAISIADKTAELKRMGFGTPIPVLLMHTNESGWNIYHGRSWAPGVASSARELPADALRRFGDHSAPSSRQLPASTRARRVPVHP